MVIVDTTVWVHYLKGNENAQTEWFDRNVGREALGLTDLILCEVLQGVPADEDFAAVSQQLLEFALFSTGGAEIAISAAQNYRSLRRRGFTVRKTVDCLIATLCMREGFSLLHRDRDYDVFERELALRVIHPR
jgi:predicted nucleic acid-binding protein